ncbi:site-specific integrase [Sphingomonas elodea]|uniref:site-specific integrase n=2 Tax=Pseudomonadota TaxID=1224 RepID=UPI0002631A52|nr:tyrosine-type recombinase/integrase [Sphingomonas elodea]
MRKGSSLLYVKIVTAKGKRYAYFDTGALNPSGRKIYKRLPPLGDPAFGATYAALLAGRTRRENVAAELTVPKLVDLFQRSPEFRQLAHSTQNTYGIYLRRIADELNTAPAQQVERRDLLMLRDKMGDRPGAANGMIRTARALYGWGRGREHVTNDPCSGVELFASTDHAPWPEDLLSAALASADAAIRLPVALLYYTAQRIGDVCALRWSDIRDGLVIVRQQKTGKELEIRVHRDLAAELERTARRSITILADPRGRPLSVNALRARLQRFAEAQGHKVVPHGLRKNAVNALLEAGCSVAETSAVTGQSLQMVEHYAKRRSTRRLADAAILKLEGGKR